MKTPILLLIAGLISASSALALTAQKLGIITEIKQNARVWQIKIDFIREQACSDTDCPSGFKFVNQNPLIRTFNFTKNTKILVLKNAGQYRQITPTEFIQARAGKNFGWAFDKTNPFYVKVDENKKTVLELKQFYLP
jgi:hypothetical protein